MLTTGRKYRDQIESTSAAPESKLNLYVVFTDEQNTQIAIRTARELARDLGARITILLADVVPYPLPLSAPTVPIEFTESTLLQIANEAEVETRVEIHLCRDREETIEKMLAPQSVVVIGRRHWAAIRERSLARSLRKEGHRVILAAA